MNSLHSKIQEITDQGIYLYQAYSIWLKVVEPEAISVHKTTLHAHPEFFGVLAESLFSSVVITLSALCEKQNPDPKKEVLSIHSLASLLSSQYPSLEANIQKSISAYEPELELLSQIRHKVYSHRDNKICPESVFNLVNISPERIHSCVAAIIETISLINEAAGVKSQEATTLEVLSEVGKVNLSLEKILT